MTTRELIESQSHDGVHRTWCVVKLTFVFGYVHARALDFELQNQHSYCREPWGGGGG